MPSLVVATHLSCYLLFVGWLTLAELLGAAQSIHDFCWLIVADRTSVVKSGLLAGVFAIGYKLWYHQPVTTGGGCTKLHC